MIFFRYLKYVVITPSQQKIKLVSPITRTGLYEEESSCKITTIGMVTLSAIQILLYYINLAFESGPIKSALQFDPKKEVRNMAIRQLHLCSRQVSTFGTVMEHHQPKLSPVHLYPNVFIQIIIGVPLEMVHGWRVLVIYVAGAFGACLAHSVIDPNVTLVGSSGGFYAFYTAHIATVIMNWREMSHPSVQLILFGIMTVFDPVYNYVIMKGEGNVSYIAHLGGTVIGLLLGVNILKNLQVTKTEQIVWYICMITYAIIMIIFIVLDILNSI
ncbi:hypothetical protein NQ318_002320 [Aromia moschata]|uniref:Peptidase S54 rhomboid domain-containing protein n=1 Tax=Aromia moschata TaxID=1265417 RepID=A0AAV8Z4D4_9CUCU|nr:hypothetical protein NQ318_002320 [Aromia moschata]